MELKLSNICENYLLQKMICTFDNKEINEKGSREDELTNKIEQLENELSLIYESKGYRFLQYVRMMKYKFKR